MIKIKIKIINRLQKEWLNQSAYTVVIWGCFYQNI